MFATDPDQLIPYVLKRERNLPANEQTVFHLRSLTPVEMAEVENNTLTRDPTTGHNHYPVGTNNRLALKYGLDGWSGLRAPPGYQVNGVPSNEVMPEKREEVHGGIRKVCVTDKSLGFLPSSVRSELAEAIREGNHLTREEGKG